MIDVDGVLTQLKSKRPLFHSEADFQHAFAWQVQTDYPLINVRLEYRPTWGGRPHIDVWLERGGENLAVELKYKTRKLSLEWHGESYELLSHSAHDVGRYDYAKDIRRLETVSDGRSDVQGVAIILTNDSAWWKDPAAKVTADGNFRVHEGRVLSGRLYWGETAGPGTRKGRDQAIELKGSYPITWKHYSVMPVPHWPEFRYAVVRVTG